MTLQLLMIKNYVLYFLAISVTYYISYNFKTALYSSAVVMKGFNISRKLF